MFFRGSQPAVLAALFGFFGDDLFRDDAEHLAKVVEAIGNIRHGAWLVNVNEGFSS